MLGKCADRFVDIVLYVLQEAIDLCCIHDIRRRVMGFRHEPLAQHDLRPAVFCEKLIVGAENPTRLFKHLHAMSERIRNFHGFDMSPEFRIRSVCQMIMQYDEVADMLQLVKCLLIELINVSLADPVLREHHKQADH